MIFRKTNQRGDTIVEVLLAMAVVGLVLGASFAIANRSQQTGRSAQERSEALKIAETQIELLKTVRANVPTGVSEFCIVLADQSVRETNLDTDCSGLNIDPSGASDFYRVRIQGLGGSAFRVNVTWDRIGGGVEERLTLVYKLGEL